MGNPRKKIIIGIEVTESFVRALKNNLALGGYIKKDDPMPKQLDPTHVLAVVAFSELCGAPVEDTYARIPFEWRQDIDIVPSARRVKEDPDEPFEADKPEEKAVAIAQLAKGV